MNVTAKTISTHLQHSKYTWLITGVAGFIGSHLLQTLLSHGQYVVGIDNFSTGFQKTLSDVQREVGEEKFRNFTFYHADIVNFEACIKVMSGVDFVLHQAALGSVPRSINDPIATNTANVTGFLNILTAAKNEDVSGFVYAASSSTYGDHPDLPKVEHKIGRPLSPYAVTKYVNEVYAEVFSKVYNFNSLGLRYFNVFGPRQNPDGAYAAVIPRWIESMIRNENIYINGDGTTSRDFTFVDNVIQANILAALNYDKRFTETINIAYGHRTSLNKLNTLIRAALQKHGICSVPEPVFRDFRNGDVKHSLASIKKASRLIGYQPTINVDVGIEKTVDWFMYNTANKK